MVLIDDLVAFLLFALFFTGTWLIIRYLLCGTVRFLSKQALVASATQRPDLTPDSRTRPGIRPYLPVLGIVAVAFVLTLFLGDGFLDLADEVQTKNATLRSIDSTAHDWAVSSRKDAATHFFVLFTETGGPAGLATLVALVSAVCAFQRCWRWIAYLLVTSIGAGVLDSLLKAHFARARPAVSDAIRVAHGFSFPSGHSMGSIVVFGALAYLATRVLKAWKWQSAAIALAITIVLSVGVSRVYLGVHWISDVAAGYMAGLLWLTACTVGYETVRRIRALRARR